ncbi:hypothetical protein KAU32_01960 [bacterium]|nr:hypothetical protein [bacterium]
MKKIIVAIILLMMLLPVFAQNKQYFPKKRKSIYPTFVRKIVETIAPVQKKINDKIAILARKIKDDKSPKTIIIILLLSFLYGVIHAVGPGHGKTLIFSYFLSEDGSIRKGILTGGSIGVLHSISSIIVVLLMYFLLKAAFFHSIQNVERIIKLISYGVIALIGFALLVRFALKKRSVKESTADIEHESQKSVLPLIIAIGIIPCTGGILIMIFCVSIGLLLLGVAAVLSMGIGMGLTISLVGVATVLSKKSALKLASSQSKTMNLLQKILEIIGALFILAIGSLLFLANL